MWIYPPMLSRSEQNLCKEGENSGEQKIVYDQVTDRSRGFAFIATASVQEAKEASRMFNGAVSKVINSVRRGMAAWPSLTPLRAMASHGVFKA
nr:33 kDa ribonucleoprotein, chloroplastic [Tanacetum cinerariifolium]